MHDIDNFTSANTLQLNKCFCLEKYERFQGFLVVLLDREVTQGQIDIGIVHLLVQECDKHTSSKSTNQTKVNNLENKTIFL